MRDGFWCGRKVKVGRMMSMRFKKRFVRQSWGFPLVFWDGWMSSMAINWQFAGFQCSLSEVGKENQFTDHKQAL
jgi:hypothetical protein